MRNFSYQRLNRARQQTGKRSGLEAQIASQLDRLGVKYGYETYKVSFVKPAKARIYTPDFVLENGIIIEAKGLFDTADRQKHLLVKEQNPQLDLRFVFSNPNQRISKKSKTTYGMWCERHGFKYAKGLVPIEWLKEKK